MKSLLSSPKRLFRAVALIEVITWAMLLTGMFLKYVTQTTDVGIKVAGPVHGFAFLAFCLVVTLVAVDQKWRPGRWLLGLLSAVPPFVTMWFESSVEKRSEVSGQWRLRTDDPVGGLEKVVTFPLRHPWRGGAVAVVLLVVVFAALLVAGPPGR